MSFNFVARIIILAVWM